MVRKLPLIASNMTSDHSRDSNDQSSCRDTFVWRNTAEHRSEPAIGDPFPECKKEDPASIASFVNDESSSTSLGVEGGYCLCDRHLLCAERRALFHRHHQITFTFASLEFQNCLRALRPRRTSWYYGKFHRLLGTLPVYGLSERGG